MSKNVLLKKLDLTNYRNIERATYEFNGNSKIVGDNKIGKTNTLESIYWLMTDKLLDGSSDIAQIKPLADTKRVVRVEAVFDVDGVEITIAKEFSEKWTKTRGTLELVMKGHETVYYYNGVKQSTTTEFENMFYKDFGIKRQEAFKVQLLQMQVDPFYIGNLCDTGDWKEVRKLIIEMVGDVSNEDVYLKEPETEILKADIDKSMGRLDQLKKSYSDNIKNLNNQIISDEAKISMLENTTKPSEEDVAIARKGIEEIDNQIATLRTTNASNEVESNLKNKIADVTLEIAKEQAKAVARPTESPELKQAKENHAELIALKQEKLNEVYGVKLELNTISSKVMNKDNEVKSLREKWLKLSKEEVNTVCPVCNRELEPEDVEKIKAERKSQLDEIAFDGKKEATKLGELKQEESQLSEKVHKLNKEVEELNGKLTTQKEVIDKLTIEMQNACQNAQNEPNMALQTLVAKKQTLEKELNDLKTSQFEASQQVATRIYELNESKAKYSKVIDDLKYYERQQEEKAKVQEEKVAHGKELMLNEQKKDLISKFIITKLQMLDSNVSKVFGNIKFKLIEENINGGCDTICKPYIYDPITNTSSNVLWKSGSKSERVVTGIAIAECIKKHFGLGNLPYLFDEGGEMSSETIATRLKTESQVICVKVEDGLKSPIVLTL